MTYSDFELRFLLALVDAATSSDSGQCEVFQVAESVLPNVKHQWVRDAVVGCDKRGYFGPISQQNMGRIIVATISREAHEAAKSVRSAMAAAQQADPVLGVHANPRPLALGCPASRKLQPSLQTEP